MKKIYEQTKKDRLTLLNEQYLGGLKRLLEKHSSAGDSKATQAVAKEMQRIEQELKGATEVKPAFEDAPKPAKKNIEEEPAADLRKLSPPSNNPKQERKARARAPREEAHPEAQADIKSFLGNWMHPKHKTQFNILPKGKASSSKDGGGRWEMTDTSFKLSFPQNDRYMLLRPFDGKLSVSYFEEGRVKPAGKAVWVRRK